MTALRRPEFVLLLAAVVLAAVAGGQTLAMPLAGWSLSAALAGDASAVRMTRAVLGLLVFGGCTWVFLTCRSIVLPKFKMQVALGALVGLSLASVVFSSFVAQSLDAWLNWPLYAAALLLAAAASGRISGPLVVLGAAAGAAGIVGLRGVLEFNDIRAIEPTYRIFAGWSNPNAVASLFILGLPLAWAGAARAEGAWKAALGCAGVFITAGLLLTQSKGGFVAAGVGLAVFLAFALAWKTDWKSLLPGAGAIALGVGLVMALPLVPAPGQKAGEGSAGAPLARLGAAGGEAEQSAGFRTLLWQSAVDLVVERPWGWGQGTFRFVSGKPGRTTQTVTAHQNFLQVAVEGGVLALLALLACAALWLGKVLAGAKSLSEDQNVLRAGCVAAVMGVMAHGLLETNLSYVGLGVLVFAVIGVSLQLSADGTAPELAPKSIRQVLALCFFVAPLVLAFFFARIEGAKSGLMAVQNPAELPAALEAVKSAAGFDGEAAAMAGMQTQDPQERLRLLKDGAARFPNTRTLRALARAHLAEGQNLQAVTVLDRALELDPNNLPALKLKMDALIQQSDFSGAEAAARTLISKEETTTFKVRSLAELVPTETYEARIWLAARVTGAEERRNLLAPAVLGLAEYARLTVPQILRFNQAGMSYGGQTPETAREVLDQGLEAARSLLQIAEDEERAGYREATTELERALSSLP